MAHLAAPSTKSSSFVTLMLKSTILLWKHHIYVFFFTIFQRPSQVFLLLLHLDFSLGHMDIEYLEVVACQQLWKHDL